MTNEKLQEIETLSSLGEKSAIRLIELATDVDPEVRLRSVEKLAEYSPCEQAKAQLLRSLKDHDELVRTEALEALGYYRGSDLVSEILECLDDADELVRGAAAVTLGKVGERDEIPALEKRLLDASDWERVSVLSGLVHLGQKRCLEELLALLRSSDYRARCATANLLIDLVDPENRAIIQCRLREALEAENTIAAGSSMSTALERL